MCIANVRIIPIAIYIIKNAMRFNLRASVILGGHGPSKSMPDSLLTHVINAV